MKIPSKKRLLSLTLPPSLIALCFLVGFNIVSYGYQDTLDYSYGNGSREVHNPDNGQVSYYSDHSITNQEALENAYTVTQDIVAEGTVLLKNNGILPLTKKEPLVPMGYVFDNPIYSGSGSGDIDLGSRTNYISPKEALESQFSSLSFLSDSENKDVVTLTAGTNSDSNDLVEYSSQYYQNNSLRLLGKTALVFLGRRCGENHDFYVHSYSDGTKHQLSLSSSEKEMIQIAEETASHVIVVCVSNNVMELGELEYDEKIDALLWLGMPGCQGYMSLAKILDGTLSPSGKTVDIFPSSLTKDPSFANFDDESDDFSYLLDSGKRFHKYEEGIYVGYRFYETAMEENYFSDHDYFNRDNGVVYPFGYGLSYTEFSQKITSFSYQNHKVYLSVSVKNNGSYSGKDVVELYYSAPFTGYDQEHGIEKSSVNLLGFAKTKELAAGQSEELTFTFSDEDMASYMEEAENADGTKGCYFLEGGEYTLSLREDSHRVEETRTLTVEGDTFYHDGQKRSLDAISAKNLFTEESEYLKDRTLKRGLFLETMPSHPDEEERKRTFSFTQPETSLTPYSPEKKEASSLVFSDMRGKDFEDDSWDELLSFVDEEPSSFYTNALLDAGYGTKEIQELKKPKTIDSDGPQGIIQNTNDTSGKRQNGCGYPAEATLASSWNTKLAYQLGNSIGKECFSLGVNGWYAPGLNIHRSAFGGRNFEYYSEDPYLSGEFAVATVEGCGEEGTYAILKHFALYEQEASRGSSTYSFVDEQTLREIYFRPFQLAIQTKTRIFYSQDGKLTTKGMPSCFGIMTAHECVGNVSCSMNKALVTDLLKTEWGFQGFVITDALPLVSETGAKGMVLAGTDLILYVPGFGVLNDLEDSFINTVEVRSQLKDSLKRLLYVQANSSILEGVLPSGYVTYSLNRWRQSLLVVDIVFGSIFLLFYTGLVLFCNIYYKKHQD